MASHYEDSKIDKILNYLAMFRSFDEIQKEWKLDQKEIQELKQRAEARYGKGIFSNLGASS